MDNDLVNTISVGSVAVAAVFCICALIYRNIRLHWKVSVNCWFCNENSKVHYFERNSWDCPTCDQYNGFTEDGDYNKEQPAQYCESLNTVNRVTPKAVNPESRIYTPADNGLCSLCNLNQQLKIRQLADFVPTYKERYNEEIQKFREYLEKTYKLCRGCEVSLHQTIGKQDSWLRPQLLSLRNRRESEASNLHDDNNRQPFSPKLSMSNMSNMSYTSTSTADMSMFGVCVQPWYTHVLFTPLSLLSVVLLLSHYHHLHSIVGSSVIPLQDYIPTTLCSQLTAYHGYMLHMLLSTSTLLLLLLCYTSRSCLLLYGDLLNVALWITSTALACVSKPTYQIYTAQVIVSWFCVVTSLWCSVSKRKLRALNTKGYSPWRHQPPSPVYDPSQQSTPKSNAQHLNGGHLNFDTPTQSDECSTKLRSQKNMVHERLFEENPVPAAEPVVSKPTSNGTLPSNGIQAGSSDPLDDLAKHWKISSPLKAASMTNSVFASKTYDTSANKNLFGGNTDTRFLIKPSKLDLNKSLHESSWVGGGFWRAGHNPQQLAAYSDFGGYPLSRSSSQSSGIFSMGSVGFNGFNLSPSSLPNSCHGSVCGDFDRTSVISEPIYNQRMFPDSPPRAPYSERFSDLGNNSFNSNASGNVTVVHHIQQANSGAWFSGKTLCILGASLLCNSLLVTYFILTKATS